jgi:hypothetical protein
VVVADRLRKQDGVPLEVGLILKTRMINRCAVFPAATPGNTRQHAKMPELLGL